MDGCQKRKTRIKVFNLSLTGTFIQVILNTVTTIYEIWDLEKCKHANSNPSPEYFTGDVRVIGYRENVILNQHLNFKQRRLSIDMIYRH